jgi:hypothetical protein
MNTKTETDFRNDTPMDAFKKYNLVFFDTFAEARAAKERIRELSLGCDQVNVVIREEGNMEDSDLLSVSKCVKIFAGKAWTSIHERRLTEGWYAGGALTGISASLDLHV